MFGGLGNSSNPPGCVCKRHDDLTQRASARITRAVRAVVICADPERATREPGSVATLLVELGGRVSLGRFDLGGLDFDELGAQPPAVVVVEAGDDAQRAQKAIRKLRDAGPLV